MPKKPDHDFSIQPLIKDAGKGIAVIGRFHGLGISPGSELKTSEKSSGETCRMTNLPDESESFSLVFFLPVLPPSIASEAKAAREEGKSAQIPNANLRKDLLAKLVAGFDECRRILKTGGVLVVALREGLPSSAFVKAIGCEPAALRKEGGRASVLIFTKNPVGTGSSADGRLSLW